MDRSPERAAPEGEARPSDAARTRAEQVARASYGRLLALLARPDGDIELAEECLAEAFARALERWPDSGVPENPEGWLLTVARHHRRDVYKSAAQRTSVALDDLPPGARPAIDGVIEELDPDAIPDRRLALLFVCGHPAIDRAVRAPLMLQTVLGFQASEIAEAFTVRTATMSQRLVRAKRRIRDARIPFAIPDRSRMPDRIGSVLEAIYGAYAIDWRTATGPSASSGSPARPPLTGEAHYLAVTLAELLPDEPEVLGLAALISFSLSRVDARHTAEPAGGYVPLEKQDPADWDAGLIARGERYLKRAHALGRIGRFQIEAAIQSVHCARASSGVTDWAALRKLYAALIGVAPTLGARVALAATVGRLEGPDAGLAVLDGIEDSAVGRFQPAWATRAHLLAEASRAKEARAAWEKAISLTTDAGVRRYLEQRARE